MGNQPSSEPKKQKHSSKETDVSKPKIMPFVPGGQIDDFEGYDSA